MTEHQQTFLNNVGKEIAVAFKEVYGYVQFNIQGGHYVNANVNMTTKPKKGNESQQNN